MKLVYNILVYFAGILLLSMISCTEQEPAPSNTTKEYSVRLFYNKDHTLTRSGISEDVVQRMDLLLFKEGTLDRVIENITSFGKTEDGQTYIDIFSDEESTRELYVLANNDNEKWLTDLIVGATTVKDVLALETAELSQMPTAPFVMSGIVPNVTFSKNPSPVECTLHRAVARIDVINKDKTFRLESARLVNAKVKTTVFLDTLQSEAALLDFDFKEVTEDSVSLYCYENSNETLESSTAIEIKGSVNGIPLTYTLRLMKDKDVIPLERNFKYTIHINGIRKNDVDVNITVSPWIIGSDINGIVAGNVPLYDVVVSPEVGAYSIADSTLTIKSDGGSFDVVTKANAECGILIADDWVAVEDMANTRTYIEDRFTIKCQPNLEGEERTTVVSIYNKLDETKVRKIIIKQEATDLSDKYLVVVVAGQSNAAGYDQSGYNQQTDMPDSRAVQLSYRRGPAPNQNLSIIPLTHNADNIDTGRGKGIHLPLAKELLKHAPEGYKILMIPVAQGGTTFGTVPVNRPYGTFNTATLAPNEMETALRWGRNSPYARTIIERTKYALELNPKNKLIGIVWCQGENDKTNSDYHYPTFKAFTEDILSQLTEYGSRTAYGVMDKQIWFTYSACEYWVNWYNNAADGDATGVFGGYKYWNPNNFIHIPFKTPSNPTDKYHFGQNAFATTVAPMVAKRMNANGALFNGVTGKNDHFMDKTTQAEASRWGGSMNDADVTNSLELFMPFRNSINEPLKGNALILNNTLKLVDATGLKDLNGNERSSKALELTRTGSMKFKMGPQVNDWSVSFMGKRTGDNTRDIQAIITNNGSSNSPFIGFKKYFSTAGVAGNAEFLAEPILTTVKNNSIPGLFLAADNVRDLDDWIHYVVTYNNITKEATVYMNGQQVEQRIINTNAVTSFYALTVGSVSPSLPGAEMQLLDLGIWSRVLQPSTVKKLFLMNYYDYSI